MPGRDELSPTYASPGLRWGIFLEDHPEGTYRFTMQKGTELDPPVPAEFGGDLDFVVCVLDRADGTPPITGYKEVPATVERWVGSGNSRTKAQVPFERTPDNWQVLTTKSMGRALKRAGYPDDTKDLKALILWRQRRLELLAIEAGIKLTPLEIGIGSSETKPDDLDAAGTTDNYGDRERDPENPSDHDPIAEAEIVDPLKARWHPAALDLITQLAEPDIIDVFNTAQSRGINVESPADKLGTLLALIRSKLPASAKKDPPAEEDPGEGGAPVPPPARPPSRGPGTAASPPQQRRPVPPPPRGAVLETAAS